jgi:DNA polymerase-3 subunit delta'
VSGTIIGHQEAVLRLQAASDAGKVASGWLFSGPRGIGKANLALAFAARLLGAAPGEAGQLVRAGDPTLTEASHETHPDLRVVRREAADSGKLSRDIRVDQVRALSQFFALTPARGGYRVGILDAADDLNAAAANALLKTLEEPPPRACLILIHHGEAPLLPTLRSRCRLERFRPLTPAKSLAVLAGPLGLNAAAAQAAELSAPGRPGLAAGAAQAGSSQAGPQAGEVLDALLAGGTVKPEHVLRLWGVVSAGDTDARERAVAALVQVCGQRVRSLVAAAPTPVARLKLIAAWRRVLTLAEEAATFNLAPEPMVLAMVRTIREARA